MFQSYQHSLPQPPGRKHNDPVMKTKMYDYRLLSMARITLYEELCIKQATRLTYIIRNKPSSLQAGRLCCLEEIYHTLHLQSLQLRVNTYKRTSTTHSITAIEDIFSLKTTV